MRWEFGSVLPADIKYNLNEQEVITCSRNFQMPGDVF